MEKIGIQRIPMIKSDMIPVRCVNCGGKSRYKVTFEDNWGKLIVNLCEVCSVKNYEDLKLQTTLNWPGIA
jgi:excinuclease UvrABC ATPase subunit